MICIINICIIYIYDMNNIYIYIYKLSNTHKLA